MLAIPVCNFLIFWAGVNIDSILLAFQYKDKNLQDVWGFAHFVSLFNDIFAPKSTLLISLKNTMIFFGSNILITLPLSLLVCYFLYRKIAGYRFFRYVFYFPSIISGAVMVVLFKYILAANGTVGIVMQKLGMELIPFLKNSQYAMKTILFYTIFFGIGGNMVLLSGAMNQINQSILEAGRIDGVGIWREIVDVVIPCVWPTLSTLLIFNFVGLFGSSGPILLFTSGAYDTSTVSYWIYSLVYYSGSYNYAAAIGLTFTVIGFPIALLARYVLNRVVTEE